MDKIIIATVSLLLIGFIVWWFFISRKTTKLAAKIINNEQTAAITISGGYTPNVTTLKQNIPAKIIFKRQDPSSCFNELNFPSLGIRKTLTLGKDYVVNIDTSSSGEHAYSCGMNMFHGKIIIE